MLCKNTKDIDRLVVIVEDRLKYMCKKIITNLNNDYFFKKSYFT